MLDFILHIDRYIKELIDFFGPASYFILFFIIFFETGVVLAPFLPGDSLLFILGVFAANGTLNLYLILILLTLAAVIGDSINYFLGRKFGERIFMKSRFFKKEYFEKTKNFYEKHGGKTIILGRFIPVVRTFAPFVAGVGKMNYEKFIIFNIIGALIWINTLVLLGYFFGSVKIVSDNMGLVIIVVIVVSLIPAIIGYFVKRNQ